MQPDHKISVIIPAYNHEKYIKDTIESVQSQTFEHIEIIIVNDGSSDNTGLISKDKAMEDPRITVHEQSNQGAHHAINYGIGLAGGNYVAVLNSDDIFLPDKIQRCVDIISDEPDVEFIAGNVELIDESGDRLKSGIEVDWLHRAHFFWEKSECLPLSILNENFIATTSNMFFSKKIWQKANGFMPLRYCHDLEFLMFVFKNGACRIDSCDHIRYRIHSQNTIKENLNRVRVEIASVIAASIIEYDMDLIGESNLDKHLMFKEFLRNKNLSDLIIFLIMVYLRFNDRQKFFSNIYKEDVKDLYAQFFEYKVKKSDFQNQL